MKHSDARTLARNLALDRDGAVSGTPAGSDVAKILNDHITRLGMNDRSKTLVAASTGFSITEGNYSARLSPTNILRTLAVTESQDELPSDDSEQPAFVAWTDGRAATSQSYVQKVNLSGTAAWTANGVVVSANTSSVFNYARQAVCASDDGGCVVLYAELITATTSIMAQRFDASGAKAWTAAGVTIASGSTYYITDSSLRILPDDSGGYYFAWMSQSDGAYPTPWVRRYDASGNAVWAAVKLGAGSSGVEVGSFDLVSDGAGGVYAGWQRLVSTTEKAFVQRVTSDGTLMWTAAGVDLGQAGIFGVVTWNQRFPIVENDGSLFAMVGNDDWNYGTSVRVTKRAPADGSQTWITGNLDSGATRIQFDGFNLVPAANGGVFALWLTDNSHPTTTGRAMLISSSGVSQWGSPLSFYTGTMEDANLAWAVHAIPDGSGNCIVLIRKSPPGPAALYAVKITAAGGMPWGEITVADQAADLDMESITSDGDGGAIAFFRENTTADVVRTARIRSDGTVEWTANGLALTSGLTGARWPSKNGSFVTRIITSGSTDETGTAVEIALPSDIYHQRSKSVTAGAPSSVAFVRLAGDSNRIRAIVHPPADATYHFAIHAYLNPPEFTTSVIDDNEVMDCSQVRQYEIVRETALDLAIILRRPDSTWNAIAQRVPHSGELAQSMMDRDMATGPPRDEPK